MRDDLGPAEVTWQTRPERSAMLVAVGLTSILVWTLMLVLGRVHLLVYLFALLTIKALVAMRLIPALARRVTLHPDGLVLVDLGGTHVLRFADLQAYYLATYPRLLPWPGEPPLARVLRLDGGGRMLRVEDDLDGFDLLIARLVNEFERRRGEALRREFEAGETVGFGPVRLHKDDGLTFGGETIPWSEPPVLTHHGDSVMVAGRGRCSLGILANPHLMVSLLIDHGAQLNGVQEALEGRRPLAGNAAP